MELIASLLPPGALRRSSVWLGVVLLAKLLLVRLLIFGDGGPAGFLLAEVGFVLLLVGWCDSRRNRGVGGVMTLDVVFSLALVMLSLYYTYFSRVPTLQAFAMIGETVGVTDSILALVKPVHLLFFVDIPVLWLLDALWGEDFSAPASPDVRRRLVLFGVATAVLNVLAGIVWPTPDFSRLARERGIVNAEIAELVTRTVVTRDIATAADPATFQEKIDSLRAPTPGREPAVIPKADLKGRNLIFIMVESLQGFAVNRTVGGRKITPNIDELAADGIHFTSAYQQVSAGNTSDGEYLFVTGLYPLEGAPVSQEFGDRVIPGLPRVLDRAGYRTMTFHPNEVTFWSRHLLYPALGYESVYDSKFYGEEDVVGLGPSDDVLYSRAAKVLTSTRGADQPFFAYFVTLTGHHPFQIPADKRGLDLPVGVEGTLVGDYLVAMNYADAALGRFVDELKALGLYDETVIVVAGDHFGLQRSAMSAADLAAVKAILGREYTEADRLNVPIVIAAPGAMERVVVEAPVGQVDVAPTLASLLGVDLGERPVFGRDLTEPSPALLGIRYYAPTGTFVNDEVLYIPATAGKGQVYDARTRVPVKDGVSAFVLESSARAVEMQRLSDAYLKRLDVR